MRDINDYCVSKGIPSLAQGMIEMPPPQQLRELASKYSLSDDVHTYRNRFGENTFRKGIQNLLEKEYNTTVTTDSILACQGVTGGFNSCLAWAEGKGMTKIGLVEPFYTYHLFQIERFFGPDVDIEYIPMDASEEGFEPNFENIENALKGGVRIMIICNPGNPTGLVWTKEQIQRIVALANQYNSALICDECYSDMVWGDNVHYSPIQDTLSDNVFVIRGFSKVLGCQSWRVGYVVSTPKTIAELMKVQDPIYICVPFLQHAMADYLSNHLEDFQQHKKDLGELICGNWKRLSEAMEANLGWKPIQPQGSMYGMFIHSESSDMEATKKALQKGVGVCPAQMFWNGTECTGYIRIHCG
eukprot:CAMPEP_0174253562 /NCGR_PEP_ID=MMETSP0439-20130205/2934_1 /TAXON_ID=0 /ORGANISM="Stereomyxa ramosa, Strain Chinc5" /LENGTH=356 /DNA_ID=CAMNT_0015334661 /DNA_START=6 /DNA_END=1073 /DNA_ORIENTATION=+